MNTCDEILTFTATAVSNLGTGVEGVVLRFVMTEVGGGTSKVFPHSFIPAQGVTDANGEFQTTLRLDDLNDCFEKCSQSLPMQDPDFCNAEVVVRDISEIFESLPLSVTITIP